MAYDPAPTLREDLPGGVTMANEVDYDRRSEAEAHHQDVVSNLLDLQARLRADGPTAGAATVVAGSARGISTESAGLLILHDGGGLPSLASAAADTEARLVSLMHRLEALQSELDGVVERVATGDVDRAAVVGAFTSELSGFRAELMRSLDDRLARLEHRVLQRLAES